MSKKITLIVDNIITPYCIARYNAINHTLGGNLLVWFQSKSDINRHWKEFPKIHFEYEILADNPIRLMGSDTHTFHRNKNVWKKLDTISSKLDEVIVCGWDSLTYWQITLFCKIHKVSYALWSGSTIFEKSWRRTLFYPIIFLVVHGATRYLAYGSRASNFLQSIGADKKKIAIFYNNIDNEHFAKYRKLRKSKEKLHRKKFCIPERQYVFLYVGQLIPRKGLSDLLAVFKKISQKYATVSLVIVGQGRLQNEVKSLQDELGETRIIHLPHLDYSLLPQLYACCNCLVLPSHEEVWGLVVNESLAAGTPVLTSDMVGSAPDLVKEGITGYTYKSRNLLELENRMLKMVVSNFEVSIEGDEIIHATNPKLMANLHFNSARENL